MRLVATSAAFLATLVAATGLALGGSPVWAAPTPGPTPAPSTVPAADLSVKLENKVDAAPGKLVTYQVTVANKGKIAANRVQIDFTTSMALANVTYSIKNGHCYRSAKETACLFYAALRPGGSAQVAISGVVPAKLPQGIQVTNQVTAQSSTALVNPADDKAFDNYRIGVPRSAPVAGPAPGPSPSFRADSKIIKITDTASHWLGYSKPALRITFAVLGAAALWFGLGLWLRRRQRMARIARGEYGDEVD